MTIHYITHSVVTSNFMTASVTTMHIFMEMHNFECDEIAFKMSYDKQNLTRANIVYLTYKTKSPKACLTYSC